MNNIKIIHQDIASERRILVALYSEKIPQLNPIINEDNKIIELETKGDFTYAKHINTGRKLWIHNDFLLGANRCNNYTDYVLPVKKGDTLKIIKLTSKGYMVKKDGVIGWYYGEIKKEDKR